MRRKKEVAILYVEADEDHISLQDGKKTISKLVYVHEGYEQGQGRNKLKNVHYFSGIYSNPEDLWLEVADYIEENYDTDKIKKVFLSGDGAGWIKEGLNWLPKAKYVLDKYHLNKYVLKATGHVPKLRFELWGGINTLDKTKVKRVFKKIMKKTEAESKIKAVRKSRQYILKNWAGIEAYMKDKDAIGCSAEGHVSHVLADRLSSRPRGWSKIGADQMSRLRAFKFNGGSQEEINNLLSEKEKERRIEKVEMKIKSKRLKTLYPEPKEVLPALKRGKVTGTYRKLKALNY